MFGRNQRSREADGKETPRQSLLAPFPIDRSGLKAVHRNETLLTGLWEFIHAPSIEKEYSVLCTLLFNCSPLFMPC